MTHVLFVTLMRVAVDNDQYPQHGHRYENTSRDLEHRTSSRLIHQRYPAEGGSRKLK